jgi:MoaE-MoaD fusion protein
VAGGMRVRVRLFARLRDVAGASELERQAEDGATVRSIWDALTRDFPEMAPYGTSISAALNADYVRMDAAVSAGDEVAFLPPVSGGV